MLFGGGPIGVFNDFDFKEPNPYLRFSLFLRRPLTPN